MLKIGDFSKLGQVSVRMLRHYDEIGLLRPVHVDRDTDYRHYSASQLPRLNRILALRDLGFSLEQIGRLMDAALPPEDLRSIFERKRIELDRTVAEEKERLARVESRLQLIEKEGKMPEYEVVIKQVEPQLVASVRGIIPRYQDVGQLFGKLYGVVGRMGVQGLNAALWHDGEYREQDVDAEVAVFLKQAIQAPEPVKVYELPGGTMASAIHKGSYNRLNEAYAAITRWIDENGYAIAGPNRELYVYATFPVSADNESYVTELQFPVVKQ